MSSKENVAINQLLAPATMKFVNGILHFHVPAEVEGLARELYASLRLADASGAELILASLPAEQGAGLAVRDRLMRAAAPKKA